MVWFDIPISTLNTVLVNQNTILSILSVNWQKYALFIYVFMIHLEKNAQICIEAKLHSLHPMNRFIGLKMLWTYYRKSKIFTELYSCHLHLTNSCYVLLFRLHHNFCTVIFFNTNPLWKHHSTVASSQLHLLMCLNKCKWKVLCL